MFEDTIGQINTALRYRYANWANYHPPFADQARIRVRLT
jgi:hypothetical protein